MKHMLFVLIVGLLAASPLSLQAENWPVWRGPNFDGTAAGESYPTNWSNEKNVAWKVAMPGRSGSTPAVWGDKIFVTSEADGENGILCLNRAGKVQWTVTVGELVKGKHRKASGANPSPTTDGKHVYAYFKSGDLVCLDFDGKVVWQKNLQSTYGENTLWWDLGTSPVLTEAGVVVAVMQTGPSYLVSLDKETGEELWKQDRNLGAPEEAAQSYSTPIVVNIGMRQQLITVGADHVTANDAATGKELWRVGGLNPTGHKYFRSIASPAVADGIVAAP
ncbi:MAG: PQQ-binding-like beta-propeller repeat protein, partial [bacterium]|nr:PQQ-binding-like beta-propeller repeat protein [bacterium]